MLKIFNFGISSSALRTENLHMADCGIIAYTAPELLAEYKNSIKFQADVWSFGVLIWELIMRRDPYKDLDSVDIIRGAECGGLGLPVPNKLPKDLQCLLKQCWKTVPGKRPTFDNILERFETLKKNAVIKNPVQKKPLQDMPSDKELVNSSSPDENSHSECLKEDNPEKAETKVTKSPVQKKSLQDMPSDKELVNSSSPDENSHSECLKEDNPEKAEVKTERTDEIERWPFSIFEEYCIELEELEPVSM
ncbi:unnamed protein product [Enterobius vermicularis]|uniref:Protein kinase domain-containing protein n=1 Tax=Enterobius vermicularis TaxID=51028 RepID=A0A0N4V0T1_ENTVE|nr:unnamed protein product [Enterobius vermicularis]